MGAGMSWRIKELRDCVTFSSGGTPNKGRPEYWGGDIPWASSGEMGQQFIEDTSLHITEAGAEAGSRLVPEGTIFAVVRGMSLATEFRISLARRRMAFNQDLKALQVKEGVNSYFLFSSLRAHANQIRALSTEAAHGTKKLDMERLESFRIRVPDVDTQEQVAAVIRDYDDLIETNRKRIALLEESARLLYREWFVDLRFPGHESVKRVNGVPEGWLREGLYDVAELTMGYPFQSSLFNTEKLGKAAIRIRDIPDVTPSTWTTEDPGSSEYEVQRGDFLIGMDGIFHMNHWSGESAWLVQRVCRVKAKNPIFSGFLALALYEPIKHFEATISGATVAHLGAKHLKTIELLMPPLTLSDALAYLNDLLDQKLALTEAIAVAKSARDALLPKLMSGKLRV